MPRATEKTSRQVSLMIVGAIIAGFVILSLLLETLTSAPKPDDPIGPEQERVP